MSSNADFVQFIADQCSGAGEIAFKRMFGEYGLYCDGTIFGLVCDDCFFLKPTDAVRPLLRTVDLRPPYEGARNYFFVADVDDHAYLSSLVRETCRALRASGERKGRKTAGRCAIARRSAAMARPSRRIEVSDSP
jgi:TfoX/Sxy family transcriptional regulator of competence genes